LQFWVDGNLQQSVECYGCDPETYKISINLKNQMSQRIKVVFNKDNVLTDDFHCHRALINYVKVFGSSFGGRIGCNVIIFS
jgi:hypothetical protein